MDGIIIQARMGSTRLPGKILMDMEGKCLLKRIVEKTKQLSDLATTVIATSVLEMDDAVEAFCNAEDVNCFRGDENNVLSRYYYCAKQYGFDNVVRMTGDNPFPDMEELKRLIRYHRENDFEYTECHSTLPIGVGMEIFKFSALERTMKYATLPKHFEHVNEYILDNKDKFRNATMIVDSNKNHPEIRLTVDTTSDYQKACYIIRNSGSDNVSTVEAIALSRKYDELMSE